MWLTVIPDEDVFGIWVSNPVAFAAVIELDCALVHFVGLCLLFVHGGCVCKHPSVTSS